ncbi:NADPH-dependent oxidoreductase [Pontibacter diazotrophicus]|uniref:NADPH-dependent oxidoreductase n=1 Tax=Pontibacter diazotrophicus TaxID=1400979 RepID=A0A3D8LFW6_9BACT|nr:NAD(P)H-dependent oxidoreductase [Pontibacter diazotrophicus]RDV16341.1 NADPH-dependent oxidoreductase [Pontibacter diazotrophicus]
MENKPIAILGSARRESDTKKLVEVLFPENTVKVLDLLDYHVCPYSYSGQYPAADQFLQVMEEILLHKQVIFATPVYWYAMSGLMKTFFDRLTDIITVQKSLGRRLAGKETLLLAIGSDEELPPGFEKPFERTSDYFGMTYKACYYCPTHAIHVQSVSREGFLKALNSELHYR